MGLFATKIKHDTASRTVLIVGPGPHPSAGRLPIHGGTIRVRQIAQPLKAAGYDVQYHLLAEKTNQEQLSDDIIIQNFSVEDFQRSQPHVNALRKNHKLNLRCIIGAGSLMPDAVAAQLAQKFKIPFWCDITGDPMAEWFAGTSDPFREKQEINFVLRDQIWLFLRRAYMAGDRFSGVSDAQAQAILGNLLMLGRLPTDGSESELIHNVPLAVPDHWLEKPKINDRLRHDLSLDNQTNVIGLTGSATSWMDLDVLSKTCEKVLQKYPDTKIPSRVLHPSNQEFKLKLKNIPEDKIIHIDHQKYSEHDVLSASNATILCDRDIAESALGSRSRLLVYLRYPIHIFVTQHAELSKELIENKLAFNVTDAGSFQLDLSDASLRVERQTCGLEFLKKYTYTETTKIIRQWVDDPETLQGLPLNPSNHLQTSWAASKVGPVELFPEDF